MAADSSTPPEDGQPRLSWRERELLSALRRLANAQAQVRALEDSMQRSAPAAAPEPGDVDRVDALEAELKKLRAKAAGRFGAGAAREKLPEVELQQRLALERLGFGSYDEFVAAGRRPVPATEPVDPAILDFARREQQAAEQAYAEVLSMPDDVDESPAAPRYPVKRDFGRERDGSDGSGDDVPATIDLTGGEGA